MKVTPDVTSNQARRVSRDRPQGVKALRNSTGSPQNKAANIELQQGISSRLTMDRSLADAFSIAQVSSSIVHKAMLVSSRLRNIAAEAVASGRVDTAALQETVSLIPADLDRFGEAVQGPPQILPDSGEAVDVTDVMKEVAVMAENLGQGTIPDEEAFDRLDGTLKARGIELAELSRGLESEITPSGAVFRDYTPDLPRQTAEAVIGNPNQALIAQGNIIPETASALTG